MSVLDPKTARLWGEVGSLMQYLRSRGLSDKEARRILREAEFQLGFEIIEPEAKVTGLSPEECQEIKEHCSRMLEHHAGPIEIPPVPKIDPLTGFFKT